MRSLLLAAVVGLVGSVGCGGGGGGGGGPGGGGGGQCGSDADCAPDVCARDGECLAADQVWAIRVTWTVNSSAANATSCMTIPDLYLSFINGVDSTDAVTFEPVPCAEGNFFADKFPTRFTNVEIGINGGADLGDTAFVGTTSGSAAFNLTP
jgi:hypothetical protein